MPDDYKPEQLRAASPKKCTHPVWVWKEERNCGRNFSWRYCPLCETDFDHHSYQAW